MRTMAESLTSATRRDPVQEVLNGTGSYPINFGGGTSGTASGLMSKTVLRQFLKDNPHLIWKSMEVRLIEHFQLEEDRVDGGK